MEVKSHASLEVGAEVRAGDDDAKKGWWPTRNADVDPHDTNRIAIHRIALAHCRLNQGGEGITGGVRQE